MIVSRQTVAGAAQFTGAVGAGLLTWITDYGFLTKSRNITAGILGYSYDSTGAAHTGTLVLRRPGGAATERAILENRTNITDFTQICSGEGLIVPREPTQVWELAFVTVGKANTATLTVWWAPRTTN